MAGKQKLSNAQRRRLRKEARRGARVYVNGVQVSRSEAQAMGSMISRLAAVGGAVDFHAPGGGVAPLNESQVHGAG